MSRVIPLLLVFLILVINVLIQTFMGLLSNFEKHKNLSQHYASQIIKIFACTFINTGLVILIVNLKEVELEIYFVENFLR